MARVDQRRRGAEPADSESRPLQGLLGGHTLGGRRRELATIVSGERVVIEEASADELTVALLSGWLRSDELDELDRSERSASLERASAAFTSDHLELAGRVMPFDRYCTGVAGLTGLPVAAVRRGAGKLRDALAHLAAVVPELPGPMVAYDGELRGPRFVRVIDQVAVVAPGNTPGAHAGWLPVLAAGASAVVKAATADPLTPHRLHAALVAGGLPASALGVVHGDHQASRVLLARTPGAILFGSDGTLQRLAHPRALRHGTGRSKVFIGASPAHRPVADLVDVVEESVTGNAGRACIDASAVWVDGDAGPWADAIAARLSRIEPQDLTAPTARLAAFTSEDAARGVAAAVDDLLAVPGAREVTDRQERVVHRHGGWFVRPAVLVCDSPAHPAADTELPIPFVGVVSATARQVADAGGLSVAALTDDPVDRAVLAASPSVRRLVLGQQPTNVPDLEHVAEGDPVALLYERRGLSASSLLSRAIPSDGIDHREQTWRSRIT